MPWYKIPHFPPFKNAYRLLICHSYKTILWGNIYQGFTVFVSKNVYFFFRKALKEFTPLKTDTTETEQFNSILNEIEVLKKLSTRSEYVIKYLDSFSTDVLSRFKVYYIVTNLYEVNYSNFESY